MEKMRFNSLSRYYNSFTRDNSIMSKFVTEDVFDEFKDYYSKNKDVSILSNKAYKELIYSEISSFEMDKSQALLNYEINFTDAAISKMKVDCEYRNWVFSEIKSRFSKELSVNTNGKMVINFTENKEDLTCEYVELKKFEKKEDEKKSFWQLRKERQEKINKEIEEKEKKRRLLEKLILNRNIETINQNNLTYAIRSQRAIKNLTGEDSPLYYHPMMKEPLSLFELLMSIS